MVTRRQFALGAGTVALSRVGLAPVEGAAGWPPRLIDAFARIEAEGGGRLGVALLDTGSGARAEHRGTERFPLCSTFKLLAASAVLARVDQGDERLDRRVQFAPDDLVTYSPATQPRAGGAGMTLAELCEAAVVLSDNTAANLLLGAIGGPAGLTAYLRGLGDATTRLDRIEPDLNAATPGDVRDTTSPVAMTDNLQRLVLGEALSARSRDQLTTWLVGNRTGDARLRAGLPQDWRVGDKTGTGDHDTANDVAVLWPRRRAPLVLTVYLTGAPGAIERRNSAIAAVARAVAAAAG